jgi:hypothetical protein
MATVKEKPPYKPNREELNGAIEKILEKVCFFEDSKVKPYRAYSHATKRAGAKRSDTSHIWNV